LPQQCVKLLWAFRRQQQLAAQQAVLQGVLAGASLASGRHRAGAVLRGALVMGMCGASFGFDSQFSHHILRRKNPDGATVRMVKGCSKGAMGCPGVWAWLMLH